MKKTRMIAAFLLTVMLAVGITGCAQGSKINIKPDVAEAYDLDKKGEALITELFEDFDQAFDVLKKKKEIDEEAMLEYVGAVVDAFEHFDKSFESYQNKIKEKFEATKEGKYSTVYTGYIADVQMKFDVLKLDLLGVEYGVTSAENLIEDAFDSVNELSMFFCDENRITDDDVDALAG